MHRAPPLTVVIIPIVWAFIGGSAARMFGVQADYALLVAGAILTSSAIARSVAWMR
jgi:hypothetical protein